MPLPVDTQTISLTQAASSGNGRIDCTSSTLIVRWVLYHGVDCSAGLVDPDRERGGSGSVDIRNSTRSRCDGGPSGWELETNPVAAGTP